MPCPCDGEQTWAASPAIRMRLGAVRLGRPSCGSGNRVGWADVLESDGGQIATERRRGVGDEVRFLRGRPQVDPPPLLRQAR